MPRKVVGEPRSQQLLIRVTADDRPVRRVLSRGGLAARAEAVIHLRLPLPTASSGLPAGSGGQPSNACAEHRGAPF